MPFEFWIVLAVIALVILAFVGLIAAKKRSSRKIWDVERQEMPGD